MTMVIIALALSAAFIAVGLIGAERPGFDGIVPFFLGVAPGAVGLVMALVALAVHLIPATAAWSWLPATLSCGATVSMVAYMAGAAVLFRLLG